VLTEVMRHYGLTRELGSAGYFETEHQFLAALPEDLRFFFRELIRLARTYTTLDDLEHYQTTRLNPVCRRAILTVGQRLQEQGILDQPEDAFFLRKPELEQLVAVSQTGAREEVRRKVREAMKAYEESGRQPPSWVLDEEVATVSPETALLRGLPGSPGRVTGPCFLVRVPEDFVRSIRRYKFRGSSGKVFGFVYSGLDLGSLVAPPIYGWLLDRGRPRAMFVVIAAVMFVMILTVIQVRRRVVLRAEPVTPGMRSSVRMTSKSSGLAPKASSARGSSSAARSRHKRSC